MKKIISNFFPKIEILKNPSIKESSYRPDSRQAADNGPQHSSLLLSAVSRKVIAKNPSSHEQCLSRVSSEQGRKCVRMMITIMISKRPDRFPLKNSCKDALNDALSDPCHISSRDDFMVMGFWNFNLYQEIWQKIFGHSVKLEPSYGWIK